jgi:hypothetical protein
MTRRIFTGNFMNARMRVGLSVSTLLIWMVQSVPVLAAGQPGENQHKKIVVAMKVTTPDLFILQGKTTFSLGRGEKKIELTDFDFRAALTDELQNSINQKKVHSARLASETDGIDFESLWEAKSRPPEKLDADFVMLVRVEQYAVWTKVGFGANDRFFLQGDARVFNRSGKKIWSCKTKPPVDEIAHSMTGGFYVKSTVKTEQLFGDNQKAAKDGVNRIIEKWCRQVATGTAEKNF